MELTAEQAGGATPVTVLAIRGSLDARSFERLITEVSRLYAEGTRRLLLDLTGLTFMGSSGLVALRSVALVMRGEQPPDPEHGWAAFHALDAERGRGPLPNVKLLGPSPQIERTLGVTGMTDFFEIHRDRAAALASFA